MHILGKTLWVVDPIDGSANYHRKNPTYAIAIALVHESETLVAVIYLPESGKLFSAVKGQGAYCNDQRMQVSPITTLNEAIALAGDVTKEGDLERASQRLQSILRLALHTRRIRMIGSAATNLCYLASRKADVLLTYAPGEWDIAAGLLILQEAGGGVQNITIRRGYMLYLHEWSLTTSR